MSVVVDGILELHGRHTTCKESLANLLAATNDRHCDREAILAGLNVDRKTKGVILEVIVAVRWRNGGI